VTASRRRCSPARWTGTSAHSPRPTASCCRTRYRTDLRDGERSAGDGRGFARRFGPVVVAGRVFVSSGYPRFRRARAAHCSRLASLATIS
jgi:hypothetical protein